jgi:hyaluronate lyase
MALAYNSSGTKWYHDQSLRDDVLLGLQWLHSNCYNENTRVPTTGGTNNWWDYRIGSPEKLNDIIFLMYQDILPERRNAYVNTIQHSTPDVGSYTAGNLVWICKVIALSSILSHDPQKLDYAIRALKPLFDYVNVGDGFYTDGSFVQHTRHPYTGGYGVSLLSSLAELMYLFPTISADMPSAAHLYSWVHDSYEPLIYNGGMMSTVMGRGIARSASTEHSKTRELLEGLILLAQQAPESEAKYLNSLIKAYIGATRRGIGFSTITLTRMAKAIVDSKAAVRKNYIIYRQFANMDRAVQQTDHYAFAISMHSARIYNFESINQENLKGWHLSDGMTYLYNADQTQYEDDFWCTVDYQHLAGTTTEESSTALTNKTSNKTWVGGAGLFDRYGLSGMDLAPFATTLAAKKSWFMLDNQIVCLGAGITNNDNKMVLTTIDQRKLRDGNDNTFIVDGAIMPSLFDLPQKTGIHWAHLSGNVKDADLGYYFPDGIDLHMRRQPQSGRWSDVRTADNGAMNTGNYLTLWKDQGNHAEDNKGPENKYAYVLLPGYTADQVKKYATNPPIEILSNTAIVQAVRDAKTGLTGANFWKDTITAVFVNGSPYLTCDKKAAVMFSEKAESMTMAVSDPTMLNEGLINIEVNRPFVGLAAPTERIVVTQLKPTLKFSVNVKDLKGQMITVVFNKNDHEH